MDSSHNSPMSPSWREGLFVDKVVFCTGGSGSICSGQVRALVALGANACIVGRNRQKAEQVAAEIAEVRRGSVVLGLGDVDVRDLSKMKNAVDTCVERLGGIDFVIAGAAGNFIASIDELSFNAFKAVVDIDLLGSFLTAKLTLPYLVQSAQKYKNGAKGPGGRLIFVSSTNYQCARLAQAHVCAAKAGVNALSNCISLEYGPKGVTSNVIAPGPIDGTEGNRRLADPSRKQALIQSIPVQRMGTIRDIADATIFLFADTGGFVNGATIDVDGGAWRIKAAGAGPNYPFDLPRAPPQGLRPTPRSKI